MSQRAASLLLVTFLLACGDSSADVDAGDGVDAATDTGGSVDADDGVDAPRPPPFVGPTGGTDGCGEAAPEAGTFMIDVAGETREYILAYSGDYDASTPVPLIFAFHGLGDSATNFRNLRFEDVSGGITVYLNGTPQESLANARGWVLDVAGKDVDLFDAVLAEISASMCVDRARVFSTGFSYGGFFTNVLGCARGDLIRAVAPVSGGGNASGCVGQAAVVAIHGTSDTVVPSTVGRGGFTRWLFRNGCSGESEPDGERCRRNLNCDDGYPAMWCEHDGDHVYPPWVRGEIWRFFEALPENPGT